VMSALSLFTFFCYHQGEEWFNAIDPQ